MSLINPDTSGIVDGQVGDAADWITPFNTITNEFNGNISNDNIASNASIALTKIASVSDNSSSGYFDLGTMRIQWGTSSGFTVNSGSDNATTITLPVAFSSTTYTVTVTISGGTAVPSNGSQVNAINDSKTTTNFVARAHNFAGGATGTIYYDWIAFGRKP